MHIRMVGQTDRGQVRKKNQDSFYFDETHGFSVVADGIGGRKAGEVASGMVVEGMREEFMHAERIAHGEVHGFLSDAIDKVNSRLMLKGDSDERVQGMGTTLNCLMFVGGICYIGHVGDSRTYLYDRGHFWQLTIDHNVSTFLERGWMSPSEVHPKTSSGALVKAMGLGQHCEPDIYDLKIQPGQFLISCSDGLYSMVSDRRMAAMIKDHIDRNTIDQLPDAFIARANQAGGKDNITVVVAEVMRGAA